METVLNRIVKDKQLWLSERMKVQPLESFISQVEPSDRSFYQALKCPETAVILECKKASPSKGLIRADFDPEKIAATYRQYASAISVLTDEKYFQGSYDYLTPISNKVTQPILCKDFIIDAYQIYLARYYRADAILLMLSVVDDRQYLELTNVAHQLNMGVLTEVSNQEELNRAHALKARVVGINNRDLRDLSINLSRTKKLAPQLPKDVIVISESGIHTHQQLLELSAYANGFLIGSALMAEDNLEQAIRKIIFGINKVCGLTRRQDALNAFRAGAIYGGLIFVDRSPRRVSLEQAREICRDVPLSWVGVFSDESLDKIVAVAKSLSLTAVQLHRHSTQSEIDYLRQHLPVSCQIWQALSVSNSVPEFNFTSVDRYLLDNGRGGTGQTFNWRQLAGLDLSHVILAGGLNVDNAHSAMELGCFALDFNSGLESSPGIKEAAKIARLFNALRLNKKQTLTTKEK